MLRSAIVMFAIYRDKKVVGVFVRFRAPLHLRQTQANVAFTRTVSACTSLAG
jgi:hypothetical protein